jgi:endoglucanase
MKLFSDLGALLTFVAFAGACAHSAAPPAPSSTPSRPEPRAPLVEPPAPRPLTGENPFSGVKLYVDPDTSAAQGALRLRASDPAAAGILERIARQPQGLWIGDWNHDVFRAVDHLVRRAEANRAVPVIIAYNLPYRDAAAAAEGVCHSCGGLSSEEAYRRWIRDFHAGIGGRRVVVVLEPDALAGIDTLPAAARTERLFLVNDAIRVLRQNPVAAVYIDAGNPAWVPAEQMAEILKRAGIEHAHGFSLNVSNYETTEKCLEYGRKLSALTGGKHFVIDTSRNGAGPYLEAKNDYESWCNPPGRKLGTAPTSETGDPLADAFLWLKHPGESDGECAGGPRAGTWWPEMALQLAR